MRGLDEAESQVRMNESRLSEEDIVPADTAAIQNLSAQLGVRKRRHTVSPTVAFLQNLTRPFILPPEVAGGARRAGGHLSDPAVAGSSSQRGGSSTQQAPPRPQPRAGALPGTSQSDGREVERNQEADGDTVSVTGSNTSSCETWTDRLRCEAKLRIYSANV